jgi:hypothetical protein
MNRRQLVHSLALAGLVPSLPTAARAAGTVRTLYPGMSLSAMLAQCVDDDVIEVMPGLYSAQVGTITQRRLTIRGIGSPRPVFRADGVSAQGKGILVVRNAEKVVIENLEFRGARVPDLNGAGIRFEIGNLVVRNCAFFDNEMGILTAHDPNAVLDVSNSEFGFAANSPAVTSPYPPHLIYVGRIKQFTLTGCYFHDGLAGHLVKSRAQNSIINYNLLVDGPNGKSSYELDLPEGGMAWVIGNVISQSALTQNSTIVTYGEETSTLTQHGLYMANNTLINNRSAGTFVRVSAARLSAGLNMRVVDNLLVGPGSVSTGTTPWTADNRFTTLSSLQAPSSLNFRLLSTSPLRGTGVAPGTGGGRSLAPPAEFQLPRGTTAITAPTKWSPGAFQ